MEWDYKIKKDFESFLSRTGLVHKDKIKYYVYWINKFLYFSRYRPNKPVSQNIPSYLEKLEKDERIKDWQVKQAADTVRAKRRFKLPVVLSRKEVNSLFSYLSGQYLLMAKLLYGSGLRLLVGISCIQTI